MTDVFRIWSRDHGNLSDTEITPGIWRQMKSSAQPAGDLSGTILTDVAGNIYIRYGIHDLEVVDQLLFVGLPADDRRGAKYPEMPSAKHDPLDDHPYLRKKRK